jgi:hydrogenase maturation protease
MKVLILGVGSILMTDDGIGIRAVEELQRRFRFPDNVEVLDGGTSGIELLPYISNKDYLIIIDAIKGDSPPGTVLKVEGKDVPAKFRTRISPHQLGISDLIAVAQLTGELPKELVLFGIEPERIELGIGLSEPAKANFNRLINAIVDEIKRKGCAVEPIEDPAPADSIWGST